MLAEDVMETWLTEEYDYVRPRPGDIRAGEILKVDEQGIVVDLGLKRDGFIPRADVELLGEETSSSLKPGQVVKARVVRLEDAEGNLLLSMYQARFERDWNTARELLESGEVWCGEVVDCNRGGLLVQFENLRGFVPGSHLWKKTGKNVSPEDREASLEVYIGEEIQLKVIPPPPLSKLVHVEHQPRVPGTVDDGDVPKAVPILRVDHEIGEGPQGGEPKATTDNGHVFALKLLNGEAVAQGTPYAHYLPGLHVMKRRSHRAGGRLAGQGLSRSPP